MWVRFGIRLGNMIYLGCLGRAMGPFGSLSDWWGCCAVALWLFDGVSIGLFGGVSLLRLFHGLLGVSGYLGWVTANRCFALRVVSHWVGVGVTGVRVFNVQSLGCSTRAGFSHTVLVFST